VTFPRVLLCSASMLLAGTAINADADQVVPAGSAAAEDHPAFMPPIQSAVIPVTASVQSSPPRVEQSLSDFVPLIRGEGLEGWVVQEGKSSAWSRTADAITCSSATGGWLRTEASYSDFELRFEYCLQAGGNTGIGLRSPPSGNPTFTSLEIQLLDDSAPKYANLRPDQYTGSVYYQIPATQRAKLNPAGEWNRCLIVCRGDLITVTINGDLVNEIHLNRHQQGEASSEQPKPKYLLSQRPPIGHIALQSHSTPIAFRKIEVKDLSVAAPSGLRYVELAAGDGEPVVTPRTVTVHYVGQLPDGKRFTDTRDLGAPVTVPVDNVISGWKEGIQGMKVGSRRRIIVPPSLAYGTDGIADLIPPDATLVFEVELCGFEN